jgi:hypothetical protein
MTTISTKTRYERTDGWRGRVVPVNAVGGANDTGTWSDSPCPSHLVKGEIDGFKSLLRKAGIRHRTHWGRSSNVFMNIRYVLVTPEDRGRALEIAEEYGNETRWFYPVKKEDE